MELVRGVRDDLSEEVQPARHVVVAARVRTKQPFPRGELRGRLPGPVRHWVVGRGPPDVRFAGGLLPALTATLSAGYLCLVPVAGLVHLVPVLALLPEALTPVGEVGRVILGGPLVPVMLRATVAAVGLVADV